MVDVPDPFAEFHAARLEIALELARAGYVLAPVRIHRDPRTGKKAPDYLWNGQGWHDRSSGDVAQVLDWWAQYGPTTSYLVDTGHSGVVGVDLDVVGESTDPDTGEVFPAIDAVIEWGLADLPIGSMLVDTPSGGQHQYWAADDDDQVLNAKRVLGLPIDVRGHGGHLFAPGAVVLDDDGEPERLDGGPISGLYTLRGPLVPVAELAPMPAALRAKLAVPARERRTPAAQGEIKDRRWVIEQCQEQLERIRTWPAREGTGFRGALNGAGMVLGRAVAGGIVTRTYAETKLGDAVHAVWGSVDSDDRRWIRDGLDNGAEDPWTIVRVRPEPEIVRTHTPALSLVRADESEITRSTPQTAVTDGEQESDPLTLPPDPATVSWSPIDLGPYLDGTYTAPKPSVGMHRSDGLQMLYPGAEHSVIGQTEGGKSWWALAHVAAELEAGRDVVLVHYEEQSPADTIERLVASFGVPGELIRRHFRFLAPMRAILPGDVEAICETLPSGAPVLVVNDGVNEALGLLGAKPNDVDGITTYRRRLVVPWTARGAAVLGCDHVGKDATAEASGLPINSVHKINGLSGAGFYLRARESFGRGRKGAANLYVTKDRFGHLREHGEAPEDGGRLFYLGTMVIDAQASEWSLKVHAPKGNAELDPAHPAAADFRDSADRRATSALDERVFSATAELIRARAMPSGRMVCSHVTARSSEVYAALDRLQAAGRLTRSTFGRTASYDFPGGKDPAQDA